MTDFSPFRVLVLLDHGPVSLARVRDVVPSYTPGGFVKSYDPEVGLDSLVCTVEIRDALVLPANEMIDLYRSVPSNHPTRDDGRPNRPLTAFTVEVATREAYVR